MAKITIKTRSKYDSIKEVLRDGVLVAEFAWSRQKVRCIGRPDEIQCKGTLYDIKTATHSSLNGFAWFSDVVKHINSIYDNPDKVKFTFVGNDYSRREGRRDYSPVWKAIGLHGWGKLEGEVGEWCIQNFGYAPETRPDAANTNRLQRGAAFNYIFIFRCDDDFVAFKMRWL
jgi:hypothetical protein